MPVDGSGLVYRYFDGKLVEIIKYNYCMMIKAVKKEKEKKSLGAIIGGAPLSSFQ